MTRIRYQVCVFFFFSCFIEWVTEGREGGRLFVRGEDGAREEVCGGENKLVQGKRDKSVTTATGRHTGKEEGAWGRGLKERPQFLDECGRLERRNKLRSGGTERSLRERGEGGRRRRGEG